ncbi:hypothetical protein D3C79_714100 [compost metagenome]
MLPRLGMEPERSNRLLRPPKQSAVALNSDSTLGVADASSVWIFSASPMEAPMVPSLVPSAQSSASALMASATTESCCEIRLLDVAPRLLVAPKAGPASTSQAPSTPPSTARLPTDLPIACATGFKRPLYICVTPHDL